jgi:hypothetical protein
MLLALDSTNYDLQPSGSQQQQLQKELRDIRRMNKIFEPLP